MNTKFIYNTPQPQTPKIRNLKYLPNDRDREGVLNKINTGNIQPTQKQVSPAKDVLKKHVHSYKNINLNVVGKNDIENNETYQQKLQRQLVKIRNHYQNQIKNLVNGHQRVKSQLQAKNRGLEKQKTQWKQTAMKLKFQIQNKIVSLQNNQKQTKNIQNSEENNSLRSNKATEDQLAKLRAINNQMSLQIVRIKQQNKGLKFHLGRLQLQLKNNLQVSKRSSSPITFNKQKRSHSPLTSPDSRSNQSPKHSHSVNHGHKDHSHHNSSNDLNKQVERLRKLCGKMQKIIKQRNEQIMKQKTKNLNFKYMKH